MRTALLAIATALLLCAASLFAADDNPILRWMVNPSAATATNPALRAILPNVQRVWVDGQYVVVESAGLSLQSMGSLEANDRELSLGARKFAFRFPLEARPAEGKAAQTPVGIMGAFLNGVPFYSPVSAVSYGDQDLWHRDLVAAAQQSNPKSPLLESLLTSADRHSPLIGFAFDGYPVYGPYGFDEDGKVRRFRSSYRLRAITRRSTLPDGTELSPSQEGPPVNGEFPLGTFVEDYEYVAGSGDLDEANGRFARTPEYPNGTYAYFLSTDGQGRMMYPYLIGSIYHGRIDWAPASGASFTQHSGRVDLSTPGTLQPGNPVALTFVFHDAQGRRIRFLEKVHEQPVHLLIVSADLSEFAHIHPVLQNDDSFQVSYAFQNGGTYWLFADHTPPGGVQTIARFCLTVKGATPAMKPLRPDERTKTVDGLRVKLTTPELVAGRDLDLRFDVADAATGQPVSDLEPYLGAWAHIMVLSQDRRNFIHAHPLDDPSAPINNNPWQHTHAAPGPSPSSVSTVTGFREPGLYRLWVQFKRQGNVITVPFTFQVHTSSSVRQAKVAMPNDAIRVRVSESGFEPARITALAGKPLKLAFEREDAQNCVNAVVFPELGIRRNLAAGQTTVVEIPASTAREYHFACGMNMYRGSLVIH